jgi:diketogulonate reductase-like aldo/keto reductase
MMITCDCGGDEMQAYSPIGSGGSWFTKHVKVLEHPVLQSLAKKYNKTPAQIALRWNIEMGHSVLPKSTNPERIKENLHIFDFKISEEDLKLFDKIEQVMTYYSPIASLFLFLCARGCSLNSALQQEFLCEGMECRRMLLEEKRVLCFQS